MRNRIENVVVVGGGTAGWLAAATLAARLPHLAVTLVEAPDIPTIGVGEGSWPTLRGTLEAIGIAEEEFLRACEASFKQGSRFDGWLDGRPDDSYFHPFIPPPPGDMRDLLAAWQAQTSETPFAAAMTAQIAACRRDLAPRQRGMPPYAGALNYGYHLDAGKFAALLTRHATGRLGVRHVRARVAAIEGDANRIETLVLADGGRVEGDFFLDCSGSAAVLIAGHCGAGWIDRSDVSFNDRALAVQVPVLPDSPVASQTVGTAHAAGWLWDIGLPGRRGIGCVYSSRFCSDEDAEATLRAYVASHVHGANAGSLAPRKLAFATGYRERMWHGNCVAIGQAAGFIEPLEASAIVMVELALRALAENFPLTGASLPHHAERFNTLSHYRWERIVDFLKLHYVLSRRQEPYWQAHRDPASIPPRLAGQLELWREQPPSAWDFPQVDEVFSAASQQYVLYGMGFPLPPSQPAIDPQAQRRLGDITDRARALAASLPANRSYLDALSATASQPLAAQGESART